MKKTILIGATLISVTVVFLYVFQTAIQTAIAPENLSSTIAEESYTITATADETVIDAMRTFVRAGTFTFTGRDYPGLGFFVDSINGKQNADGKYWVFYVNGVSATVGASTANVKAGDHIEWKYEKGY